MICWGDFIIDDFLGPSLKEGLVWNEGQSVMDDAQSDAINESSAQGCAEFQETRRGQRPARMVGFAKLDSIGSSRTLNGTEANRPRFTSRRGNG
ncbi:MAG: hypothetical protein AB7F66_17230 [Bacteriovoracia bacterium]